MVGRPRGAEASTASPGALASDREILARVFEASPDAKLLVDAAGRILELNTQAEHLFGYPRDELVGSSVEILLPGRFVGRHVEHRAAYMASPRTRPMGAGMELFALRKDGTELPVDIMLSPLEHEGTRLAVAVVRDITERKRAEEETRRAREMYLRELHHRVKNNLQVISSLLFLQASRTDDPLTAEVLTESRSRVRSIALVHEKLYRSADRIRIDLAEYIRDLVSDLFRTYGVREDAVEVRMDVENASLEIETAIPCGLIVTELVSNVLKHAFPDGRGGTLAISVSRAGDGGFAMVVRDDGVGLPDDHDWRSSASLGLELVDDLTRQLDGRMEVESESDAGTTFRITFREVHYRDRS